MANALAFTPPGDPGCWASPAPLPWGCPFAVPLMPFPLPAALTCWKGLEMAWLHRK